ncbi:S2P metalloprotease [Sulfodiicoccus acidiphilus]|uniref:S2P metalloprotease n=1 Tax=Sulfodiicoccus acidiphilus TaxID=1670455 RepID=A0A348B721_9CREN|nr:site-2 protease family protein [Sulfodiicoccus acidiphilus]BBD73973.1 S2P metalloprotease [Sulfodiicoccus acidiphilus]GGU02709.1 S2P metalloprotease [Sulfodiicoccus acidiphilus]
MVPFLEEALAFVSAWGLLYAIWRARRLSLERKGLQIYPFLIIWKKASRDQWFPGFSRGKGYRAFETISIGLAVLSMTLGIYLILYTLFELSVLRPQAQVVKLEPIIPGVTVSLNQVPYLLVALVLSISLHELMHALSSTSQGIKVKNGGLILLAIFPGAFVEPDQDDFSSKPLASKLKVISAGIAINLVLAAISLALLSMAVSMFSHGVLIVRVVGGSPAQYAGLKSGDVIVKVNGTAINSPTQLGKLTSSGLPLILTVIENGHISSIAVTPENGKIGVYITDYFAPSIAGPIVDLLDWLFIVNFSLTMFNGAPLIITDGGKLLTELLRPIGGENVAYVVQTMLLLAFILAIGLSI